MNDIDILFLFNIFISSFYTEVIHFTEIYITVMRRYVHFIKEEIENFVDTE